MLKHVLIEPRDPVVPDEKLLEFSQLLQIWHSLQLVSSDVEVRQLLQVCQRTLVDGGESALYRQLRQVEEIVKYSRR